MSLAIKLKTIGENHSSVATSYNNMGLVWKSKGNYDKALEYYEMSLVISIKTIGENHSWVAATYGNIGQVWDSKGNYDKALEYYEKSLAISIETIGGNHDSVAKKYYNIGLVWKSKGEYNEAITLFKKVFDIQKTGGPPFQIAECYENLNNVEKAFEYYLLSADIRKERIGINNESTLESIANTKRLAKELGKENELPDWMK